MILPVFLKRSLVFPLLGRGKDLFVVFLNFCALFIEEGFFVSPCYSLELCVQLDGEGNGTLLQYSCLENPMDGGAWWAAVHGVARSWTRLNNFTFNFHFHALEKEMATHSSVLAWRIPGMGEPGGCRLWGRTELNTTEAT